MHAQSEHFEMFSCASERESQAVLLDLERFRQVFLSIFDLAGIREPRCTVVMFDSNRRFGPYKPLYNGKPKDVGGYFIGSPDEVVIALSAEHPLEQTRETIYHEYVHLLLHTYGMSPPAWLDEGLAELYSTFEIVDGKARLGQASPYHVMLLRNNRLLPLGQLFGVTHQSADYNEGLRQGMFYAQSWALLHFWICGQDKSYQPKLRTFMAAIERPQAQPETCFREAFGMEYKEMERRLARYLQGGRYFRRDIDLSGFPAIPPVKFSPAAEFARELALVNLRWRCHQSGDTALRLLELADRAPDSPRPYELLAAVSMRQGEPALAHGHWTRAAELGSANAFVHVQLAAETLRPMMEEPSLDYRMPEALATQLRAWLDRAVTLSPNYDEAFEYLAAVEAYSHKPRNATVNHIQRRFRVMRDKARVLFYFAVMRWRLKDFGTAREIAKVVAVDERSTPPIRKAAHALLERLPREPVAAPAAVTDAP